MHEGIDWSCPVGTAVKASCAGTIASAGWSNGYGYCITITHSDGKQTRYGHLSKILVSAGDKVTQGEKIALSGNTGRSTGPHVHFEIIVGGSQVNPLNYLN
jgi:murein DD-endopeptidase MepM/ murein hydrolase activator NlpD